MPLPLSHLCAVAPAMLAVLLGSPAAASSVVPAMDIYQRTTGKSVAEAAGDAEFAITDRNFRVVNTLDIGGAIDERDEGPFPAYRVILFCNLEYARRMLELDPAYIVLCPGRITVREAPEGTIVAAPLLPAASGNARLDALMADMNRIIREIVDHAAREWNPPRQ